MSGASDRLRAALEVELGVEVIALTPVAGGDVNLAFRAETAAGPLFVKTSPAAVPGTYRQEAAGLRWLAEASAGPPVAELAVLHDPPAPTAAGDVGHHDQDVEVVRFLALRWIEPGLARGAAEEEFGRQLARLHAAGAPAFGALPPTSATDGVPAPEGLSINGVALAARPVQTFAEFWSEQRLLPLAERAHADGTFSVDDLHRVHALAARLPQLVGPPELPARTHGDLWAGNLHADADGRICLIDPLAHGSHREVDLATLRVFGGPSERCFHAYGEAFPLADGWRERVALMQLGVILLHVVMFGASYAGHARRLVDHYR